MVVAGLTVAICFSGTTEAGSFGVMAACCDCWSFPSSSITAALYIPIAAIAQITGIAAKKTGRFGFYRFCN